MQGTMLREKGYIWKLENRETDDMFSIKQVGCMGLYL